VRPSAARGRPNPAGGGAAAGLDPKDAPLLYTVNGQLTLDGTACAGERLRFRFISGCQRTVIALKIEGYEVRVMAVDGEPAEPFIARNGALLLPPGGRVDAFIDIGAPSAPTPILLHNGREARSIGRVVVAKQPPYDRQPCPRRHPCHPTAFPLRSISKAPCALI
jgi:hypothetical protein